jgi:hypothetical protein
VPKQERATTHCQIATNIAANLTCTPEPTKSILDLQKAERQTFYGVAILRRGYLMKASSIQCPAEELLERLLKSGDRDHRYFL